MAHTIVAFVAVKMRQVLAGFSVVVQIQQTLTLQYQTLLVVVLVHQDQPLFLPRRRISPFDFETVLSMLVVLVRNFVLVIVLLF